MDRSVAKSYSKVLFTIHLICITEDFFLTLIQHQGEG